MIEHPNGDPSATDRSETDSYRKTLCPSCGSNSKDPGTELYAECDSQQQEDENLCDCGGYDMGIGEIVHEEGCAKLLEENNG
jgi:hypothetical protein